MITLHKYSYSYLGQLEFSSGAFILLVGVTRLWGKVIYGKFNWIGMIWKDTHVLIKGPTAENACQSKNQALGSKELSVVLRNRFAASHTYGDEFRKKSPDPWSYMEIGEIYRRTNISATLHRSGLYGSVAKLNPLLSEDKREHTWNL